MNRSLLTEHEPIHRVDRDSADRQPGGAIVATDDEHLIREWAMRHNAEPATGEATDSGPATVHVQDGGAGIRFNFPGIAPFRSINWDEWFANFHRHALLFIYEREDPSGRYRVVTKDRLEGTHA